MWVCIDPAILYNCLIWTMSGSVLTHSGCSVTFFVVLFHIIIWRLINTEAIYQCSSWPNLNLFRGQAQSCINWMDDESIISHWVFTNPRRLQCKFRLGLKRYFDSWVIVAPPQHSWMTSFVNGPNQATHFHEKPTLSSVDTTLISTEWKHTSIYLCIFQLTSHTIVIVDFTWKPTHAICVYKM